MKQLPEGIAIEPRPSRRLALFVCTSHLVALAMLAWLQTQVGSVPFTWLAVAVLFSWHRNWKNLVSLTGAGALIRVELNPQGEWTLFDRCGCAVPARLLGSSYVSPRLMVLNFSLGGLRRRNLILLPDSSCPDQLRRLRVRLRMVGA